MSSLTVLLVDDDAAHRFMTMRALRSAFPAAAVFEAGSVSAARRALADHGDALTLAVVDLKLDHESGVDVVTAVRHDARAASIPIIIVSTSDLLRHMQACYTAGANSYVIKGTDPQAYGRDLIAAVRYFTRHGG